MISQEVKEFAHVISSQLKGKLYLVGGAVRDMFIGIPPKDFDFELFHVWPTELVNFLDKNKIPYKFNSDAKFPVYRIKIVEKFLDDWKDNWIEIGFPRKDNKVGPKHSDFECIIDPFMTLTEAAFRRDFTINAGYYDVLEEKYHHLGYLNDIKTNTLKEVHSEKFKEDSLRILRGFQFVSRFDLKNYNTVCHWILTSNPMMDELFNIDPSGVYAEFCKGVTKANNINRALDYLEYLAYGGCLFFDVINQMIHCDQNTKHHSEGNVWFHTKNVIKNAIELADKTNDQEKILLFWAAFFHDIGKMKTYALKDGQPTAHGHDVEADDLVEKYGERFGLPKKMIQQIIVLKHCHMIGNNAKNKKLYFMAEELAKVGLNFKILLKLMAADTYGSIKGNLKDRLSSHSEFYSFSERIKMLGIELKPRQPFIRGSDILTLLEGNRIDGKVIGNLLHEMKMLQYNNRIKNREEALDFLGVRIYNILNKSCEVING